MKNSTIMIEATTPIFDSNGKIATKEQILATRQVHSDFKTLSNEFNQTKDGQYANHNAISISAVKNYQINDNVFIVTNDCTNTYIKSIERHCDGIQQLVNNSCRLPSGQQITCNT